MISQVLSEANRFVRNSRALLGWLLVGTLVYGFAITNGSLSIDEELGFFFNNPFAWAEQGRWGIWLLKLVFGTFLPLPFFQPALAVLVLSGSALLWSFVFTRASDTPAAEFTVADIFRRCLPHLTFERLLSLLQHIQRRNFLRPRLLGVVRPFCVDVAVRTGRASERLLPPRCSPRWQFRPISRSPSFVPGEFWQPICCTSQLSRLSLPPPRLFASRSISACR